MFSNHNFISQAVSKSKISELKQAYLEKQLQIESLERDREATLSLLNEAQKHSHSPKPANERSQLLEEARRRQKERALLTDFKPVQQTWDGWEDQEPVFNNKERESQSSSKLPLKKDADDFKQFIDKEYLQLKQELENLRKCSKPVESSKTVINNSSSGPLNEAPVKSADKVVRTTSSVKRTVEKPKMQAKPQPFIEVKFKEKPTREREEIEVAENTQRKSSFKVESSCIEILPEGRKSPVPLTKREVERKSEKVEKIDKNEKSDLNIFQGNVLSSSKNSSGRASSVNMNEKPTDTRSQRAVWADTPQPGYNWDNRYPVFQPFNYPYYQYPPMPGYGYNIPYGPPSYPTSYAPAYPPPPPQNYHPNYGSQYYQHPAEAHFSQQFEDRKSVEKPTLSHKEYEENQEEKEEQYEPLEKEALLDYEEIVKPAQKAQKKPSKDYDITNREKLTETVTMEIPQKKPENKPEPFFITFNPVEKPEKFVSETAKFVSETNENKKSVLIEIGVKNSKSLADNFKEKNNSLAARIHNREDRLPKQDHKEKTKEELIEIRKNFVKVPKNEGKTNLIEIKIEEKKNSKEPSSELMERLATGQRARVSKEEMLKLNKKNYQQLPEVKRRQEEEKKRQEKQLRLQKAKEYEKVRLDKSRYKYVMDN